MGPYLVGRTQATFGRSRPKFVRNCSEAGHILPIPGQSSPISADVCRPTEVALKPNVARAPVTLAGDGPELADVGRSSNVFRRMGAEAAESGATLSGRLLPGLCTSSGGEPALWDKTRDGIPPGGPTPAKDVKRYGRREPAN